MRPDGYVCVGRGATLDEADPIVRAVQEYQPEFSRKLPYIYGTVRRPGPIYQRLPSSEQLRRAEPDIDTRMPKWLQAKGEIGASYAPHVWLSRGGEAAQPAEAWEKKQSDPLPWFLRGGAVTPNLTRAVRDEQAVVMASMRPRVGYAFLDSFLHEGRRYGLTTQLEILPTDRLRPIQGSKHHGFRIGKGKDIEFPFVIIRRRGAKLWLYQKSSGRQWAISACWIGTNSCG